VTEEQKTGEAEGRKKVVLLYLRIFQAKEGRFHEYVEVPADQGGDDYLELPTTVKVPSEWTRRAFKKALAPGSRPGAVYEFVASKDGKTVYPGTKRFLGLWPNADDVVIWRSVFDAEKLARDALAREKKEAGRNCMFERLEPIRTAYWRLEGRERAAFLTRVMTAIMNPKTLRTREEE
jgi:hypothetical protein